MRRIKDSLFLVVLFISLAACQSTRRNEQRTFPSNSSRTVPISSPLVKQLVEAAIEQTTYTHSYDPTYVRLSYPAGDVPLDRGVCTDVIIRAFRKNGIDLQKEVHEDMARHFSAYPQKWGLSGPDSNIDHRRVPNLMTYFERQGTALSITDNAEDYLPGDIVAWQLSGNTTHIGMMTNILSETHGGFQVVHHMGGGVKVEEVLFAWRIIGHYRCFK
ncbi:MAG TPA: DUF1287 domain-containing protein [Pyrinomonadaceae bacterium]|jgi:hypothetical protein